MGHAEWSQGAHQAGGERIAVSRAWNDKFDYAIERYTKESNRLSGVLDKHLAKHRFVACDEYSIADMAIFPWMRGAEARGSDMSQYPNVRRWFNEINARPAVQRGVTVLASQHETAPHDAKSWEILFGAKQFERH